MARMSIKFGVEVIHERIVSVRGITWSQMAPKPGIVPHFDGSFKYIQAINLMGIQIYHQKKKLNGNPFPSPVRMGLDQMNPHSDGV